MKIYNELERRLLLRGFTKKQIINNKGLIGAVIDEFLKEDFYFAAKVPKLDAIDEQGTPIVGEYGSMICNCAEPEQSMFPNEKWICLKCWGEWYR